MAEAVISPNYFAAVCCGGDTYADAHAGVNGTTGGYQYISVGQMYRDEPYDGIGYHIERLVAYFDLTSLVGKTITSAILHVKFQRGTVTWFDNDWDWNLQFRANPSLNLAGADLVENFLAALGGTIFDTKYVDDYPVYDWVTFNVLAYVTAPTFTLSITSDRDEASTPPSPSNKAEAADFKSEFFTPGETDRIKLVIEYEEVLASTVTTDPATVVGTTSSTPNGTLVNDGGEACNCGFEWGETVAYEHGATPTESKVTGETFSQIIIGLDPNTTYHFRAFATNAAGTSYGADRTFTTKGAPIPVVINKAYALSREEL